MQVSRKMLVGLVVGAAAVGSMVSVAAQNGPGTDPGSSERSSDRSSEHRPHHPGFFMFGPPIRSEAFLSPKEDGGEFRTLQTDSGEIESISGSTLTIAEEDGRKVDIPVQNDTRIRRDDEEAELSDLEVGDHVHAMRLKEGDGDFHTEGVMALSPERYQEMEQRREACRSNPASADCPHPARRPGPGGNFGDGNDVNRAPAPAPEGAELPV